MEELSHQQKRMISRGSRIKQGTSSCRRDGGSPGASMLSAPHEHRTGGRSASALPQPTGMKATGLESMPSPQDMHDGGRLSRKDTKKARLGTVCPAATGSRSNCAPNSQRNRHPSQSNIESKSTCNQRAIPGTLPASARSVSPHPPEPESTCYLPRRTTINGSRNQRSAGRAPLLEGGLAEHRLL
jgi:hypothetical protein